MGKTTKAKKKNIKVSLITTFYNAEKFILNTLESVHQQIVEGFDLEYVIVDDKSPDQSRAIVEGFMIKHKIKEIPNVNWKLIEPENNLGCGGARKFGIDNATGDYFMFIDADDYFIKRDFIKRALNDIINEDADIVEYGVAFNHGNGQVTHNTASKKMVISDPILAELALFKDNLIKFNVWSKIYKRSVVESYPYSITRVFEDVRTIPIWINNAKKIVIMPSEEINYRAAGGSIIRSNMVETRLGTITAIAELFPRFEKHYEVLKAMYGRAMVDLEAMLHNHSSENEGFNEMSRLNTYMLKYIYPTSWKEKTFHIEDESPEVVSNLNE